MNVLSLFDGMSCGRVALERCGFKIDKYYASEIDKYAIAVAANNYLDTIHLGDVTQIKGADLDPIDIVIGGNPCQGFSFAGRQLNFNDPRSMLFFEFVRLVKECKPKYFFLENVRMKKEHQDVISKYLGVQPESLNSELISAQNRPRIYWTNIPGYNVPTQKGLLVRDILQDEVNVSYLLSGEALQYMARLRNGKPRFEYHTNPKDGKAACLTANMYKGVPYLVLKDSGCQLVGKDENLKGHDIIKRIYSRDGKSPTLTANSGGNQHIKIALDDNFYRRLTPIECERLQTLPDNYTLGVSNSQRYKMLGNGWTVDAVCEFFKHIPKDLDLF